jgi:tetratricopeptide (TPR) repeat protein/transcriptional regulator with XRE-family HTH domain
MFGQVVREHRLRLGITQEELAELAGIGVRTIRDIEAGRVARPRPGTVRLLAKAFGLSETDGELFHRLPSRSPEEGDRPEPAQLPLDVAGFVGRDPELTRLDGVLAEGQSVIVVSGTAGVGKTRLALHWGHRVARSFPDGQMYVNLRGFEATNSPMPPAEALLGFLDALGVPSPRLPRELETQASLYRTLLANRRMLILLDNARDADQVRPLLPGTPGSLVLITSRNQLSGLAATEGAHQLTLDLLSHAEARWLLAHRLGRRVDEEPEATDEIVGACARLSLALAIVAARAAGHPAFPLAALAAELREGRDRLQALGDDTDPLSDVRTALSWSYRALSPEAARLFRLLGLATGYTISVVAAAALAGYPQRQTRRLLAQLTRSNLIEQLSPDRFTFHDLLRLYAAERARIEEDPREYESAPLRLLHHYRYTADAAACLLAPQHLRLAPPPPPDFSPGFEKAADASRWLDIERANLVAAVCHAAEHGPRPLAWQLAHSLRGHFWLRMNLVDWRTTAHAALAAAEAEADVLGQTAAEFNLGNLHFCEGRNQHAIDRYTRALELATSVGWLEGQAAIRGNLGPAHQQIGQLHQAAHHITQALATHRRLRHLPGQAVNLINLGIIKWVLGELSEAAECYSQALACSRKIGSPGGEAAALGNLAEVRHALGHHDEARECIEQARAAARSIGARSTEAETLRFLATWHRDLGRLAEALEFAEAALTMIGSGAPGRFEVHCLNALASIHDRMGDHGRALELYTRSLELGRATADRYPLAASLIGAARAHHHLGRPETALAHAEQALTVTRHAGYRLLECEALQCLAAIGLAGPTGGTGGTGDPAQAADWARQALRLHAETGYRIGEDRARRLYAEAQGRLDRASQASATPAAERQ